MLIEIEKKTQLYQLDANPGESMLYAGLRAGIPLPYECATGTCGTCKARLVEGDIDQGWKNAPGKKNHKSERGEFLLCQATAKTNCKLGVPAKIKAFRDDDIAPDYQHGITTNWRYLTSDVIQFDIELDRPVRYHPGQFFVIKATGVEGYRAYSMVNYVESTSKLEFIIKLKPGGAFSAWAADQAKPEQDLPAAVELFGPLGRAMFHADEDRDLTMITGGSGIAGLMSIMEHATAIGYPSDRKVRLFFGVRTLDDLFFASRLLEIKAEHPNNVDIHVVLSMQEAQSETIDGYEGILFSSGMVHERALESLDGDNSNTLIYMAGPQPMVDAAVRPLILEAKIAVDMIRFDKFS